MEFFTDPLKDEVIEMQTYYENVYEKGIGESDREKEIKYLESYIKYNNFRSSWVNSETMEAMDWRELVKLLVGGEPNFAQEIYFIGEFNRRYRASIAMDEEFVVRASTKTVAIFGSGSLVLAELSVNKRFVWHDSAEAILMKMKKAFNSHKEVYDNYRLLEDGLEKRFEMEREIGLNDIREENIREIADINEELQDVPEFIGMMIPVNLADFLGYEDDENGDSGLSDMRRF